MSTPSSGRRGLGLAMAAAALATAAAGVVDLGLQERHPPAPAAAAGTSATALPAARRSPGAAPAHPFGPTLRRSAPTWLRIPAIDLDAQQLVRLGREPDGSLEVPAAFALPGWYHLGPAPGQLGAAVIAGHVDSTAGPAVFWRLGQLHRGDEVRVGRRDGTVATFRVYAVAQYPKDRFPTVRVYGNTTDRAELRLITCGGSFDAETGHYRDNTVVFARLVRTRSAGAAAISPGR